MCVVVVRARIVRKVQRTVEGNGEANDASRL